MDLEQLARKTARTIAVHPLCDLEPLGEKYATRIILEALNEVVKEKDERIRDLSNEK